LAEQAAHHRLWAAQEYLALHKRRQALVKGQMHVQLLMPSALRLHCRLIRFLLPCLGEKP
jgi:hypothetical protein